MPELSDLQNNFAMIVEIDRLKIEIMGNMAEQFEMLGQVVPQLKGAAQVFRNTVERLIPLEETSKKGMQEFDMDGSIQQFLENHELGVLWKEKV